MIEANIGLVRAIAGSYRRTGASSADLIQEGIIGLIKAVEGFDPERGVKFSSYASWWIRRSLLDAIGAERTIRIPPRATHELVAIGRAEEQLRRRGHQNVTSEAIAARAGLPVSSVRHLQHAARVTASLEDAAAPNGSRLADLLSDPDAVNPEERLEEAELRSELASLLRLLPARHRDVLIRRYGIAGAEPESHARIGARLGVKEERSRQLEREALHRLHSLVAPAGRAA